MESGIITVIIGCHPVCQFIADRVIQEVFLDPVCWESRLLDDPGKITQLHILPIPGCLRVAFCNMCASNAGS
jgi:hypothetical protein